MLIGIVGKPNVGKSTFFKALTLTHAEIANYPFTTIQPNHGIGYVRVPCPETHFHTKCRPKHGFCKEGIRFVPVELLDVAGLVPGAHEGKGRGNQFLDDLRAADAFIHVIDLSGGTNELGEPVAANSRNPAEDVRFLDHELDLWYLRLMRKTWEKFVRTTTQEKGEAAPAIARQLSGLNVREDMVVQLLKELRLEGVRLGDWQGSDLERFAERLRQETKRMLIAANKADVPGAADHLARLQQEFPKLRMRACSAECELALREAAQHGLIAYTPGDGSFAVQAAERLSVRQAGALSFIEQEVLGRFGTTGVQECLNATVFELLKCKAVFPVANPKFTDQDGNVLPDCFLVPPATTALQFAFLVHTDLGQRFVRAVDLRRNIAVGKDHVLQDGDVIQIVSAR